MEILRASLSSCGSATNLVVAIDVLRAFTTSAYLFEMGVEEIFLVSGVEDAFNVNLIASILRWLSKEGIACT